MVATLIFGTSLDGRRSHLGELIRAVFAALAKGTNECDKKDDAADGTDGDAGTYACEVGEPVTDTSEENGRIDSTDNEHLPLVDGRPRRLLHDKDVGRRLPFLRRVRGESPEDGFAEAERNLLRFDVGLEPIY
jgi:hypothetical protein